MDCIDHQLYALVDAEAAGREHQIIAAGMPPHRIGIEIKELLSHTVYMLDAMERRFFIQMVARHNAANLVCLVRIAENGQPLLARQDGGGAAAHDHTRPLSGQLFNNGTFCFVGPLAFRVKCITDTGYIRIGVAA